MKIKTLSQLFNVGYGNKFDMNKMKKLSPLKGGVHFVGRSSENHGVSASVAIVQGVDPYPAGWITVALGGSKLLSSFVQEKPFYTAQNVAVLEPLTEMTFAQKLFVCLCIRHNRFRYSAFGREANRTIRTLEVPAISSFPGWISKDSIIAIDKIAAPATSRKRDIDVSQWKWFTLSKLFKIEKGKRLTKAAMVKGTTPFIGAIDSKNGVSALISLSPSHPANTLTVVYNGAGVAETFYQPQPYRCSDDVNVLYPKFAMTPFQGLFIATILRREKYRFSYGRKWHLERMTTSTIRLPSDSAGNPDWKFMDAYMRSLPFSSAVAALDK